MLLPDISQITQ